MVIDADASNYEATLNEPQVFTKTWTFAFQFKRPAREYQIFEYGPRP